MSQVSETVRYCADGASWGTLYLAVGLAVGNLVGEVRVRLERRRRR
jgi:hypothetical protein